MKGIVLLIITYIVFIGLGLPDSLFGASWPSMHDTMGVPLSYAAILPFVSAIGPIFSSLYSDRIVKKLGTSFVLIFSLLIAASSLIAISFVDSFYMFCIIMVPLGFGGGSIDATLNNYAAVNYKPIHMNWLHSFWAVGAFSGPLIMSYYLGMGHIFQTGYRVVGFILLGIAVIVAFSLPLWKTNKGVNSESSSNEIKIISKRELLKLPGVKQAILVFVLYCGLEFTLGTWASTYAVARFDLEVDEAAMWGSLFFVGITVGRIISGLISTKLSSKHLIHVGISIMAIGIVLTTLPFGEVFSLIGLIVTGLGCAPVFPSMMHETPRNFGSEYSQSIIGLQMIGTMIGSLFIPSMYGLIGDITSYEVMPYFNAVILVVLFIVIRSLYSNVKK